MSSCCLSCCCFCPCCCNECVYPFCRRRARLAGVEGELIGEKRLCMCRCFCYKEYTYGKHLVFSSFFCDLVFVEIGSCLDFCGAELGSCRSDDSFMLLIRLEGLLFALLLLCCHRQRYNKALSPPHPPSLQHLNPL